jgi:SPP1 gp7 family putative phage head morphogenesis protein
MAKYLTGRRPQDEQRFQAQLLEGIEARFQPAIAREIARAMREAIRDFENSGEVPLVSQQHRERMTEIVLRMSEVGLRVMAGRILNAQRADSMVVERKDFATTVNRLALRYITLEAVRRRIVGISETTRATIVDQVARGFQAGLGQDGVARLIRRAVPEIARYRSAMIARTETHSAAGYGAQGAAQETGLGLNKQWVSAEDERTRETHSELDGTIVPMDDFFEVGGFQAQFPGDPALPPEESINCRCIVAHIVAD